MVSKKPKSFKRNNGTRRNKIRRGGQGDSNYNKKSLYEHTSQEVVFELIPSVVAEVRMFGCFLTEWKYYNNDIQMVKLFIKIKDNSINCKDVINQMVNSEKKIIEDKDNDNLKKALEKALDEELGHTIGKTPNELGGGFKKFWLDSLQDRGMSDEEICNIKLEDWWVQLFGRGFSYNVESLKKVLSNLAIATENRLTDAAMSLLEERTTESKSWAYRFFGW